VLILRHHGKRLLYSNDDQPRHKARQHQESGKDTETQNKAEGEKDMNHVELVINTWPRGKHGEPIFHNGQEAKLFAQLTAKETYIASQLKLYRQRALDAYHAEKSSQIKDLNIMMRHATSAMLLRECYQEVERIREAMQWN